MMNCKWRHVDLGWRCGAIYEMCDDAVQIAKLLNTQVSFTFNGVRVNVSSQSDAEDVSFQALEAVKNKTDAVFGKGCY